MPLLGELSWSSLDLIHFPIWFEQIQGRSAEFAQKWLFQNFQIPDPRSQIPWTGGRGKGNSNFNFCTGQGGGGINFNFCASPGGGKGNSNIIFFQGPGGVESWKQLTVRLISFTFENKYETIYKKFENILKTIALVLHGSVSYCSWHEWFL